MNNNSAITTVLLFIQGMLLLIFIGLVLINGSINNAARLCVTRGMGQ